MCIKRGVEECSGASSLLSFSFFFFGGGGGGGGVFVFLLFAAYNNFDSRDFLKCHKFIFARFAKS